jgi:PKD repeat protein
LRDASSNTLDSKTVNVATGWNTVELGFDLPVGNDFQLVGQNLFRNNNAVSYPYSLPGYLSITRSSANTNPNQYYYYFYDWKIQEKSCVSQRTEVIANVNSTVPQADFSTTLNDPYVQFNDLTTDAGHNYWNFGDQSFSQQKSPMHTYLQNGTYQVQLKVDNGCGTDSISKTVVINLATGIEASAQKSGIKVYPNPSQGIFNIELDRNYQYQQLEIISIVGRTIFKQAINPMESAFNIDLSMLSPGVYFIRFTASDKTSNIQIIKQ